MSTFEQSLQVNALPDRLYQILQAVKHYPDFVPHVKSVQVLERDENGNRAITEWCIVVPGFGIEARWKAEEQWDATNRTYRFRPAGEALAQLEGEWKVEPEGDGSRLFLKVTYTSHVPALFQAMAQKAVEQNLTALMEAIKKKAEEEPCPEQR